MRIVNIKELEDCFDGSFMKEVLFDETVSRKFIHYLGESGDFEYFPSFAKPFYRVVKKGLYQIKGVEGNRTLRIILNRKNREESLSYFEGYVKKYKGGENDKNSVEECKR